MIRRRIKAFTLLEVIVVIAIIGILAAIIVPMILEYVRLSRVSQFNANAKSVFSGAQLAITDSYNEGLEFDGGEIFINTSYGNGQCIGQNDGEICDITDYIGGEFKGYFGFVMDSVGTGVAYAMWSDDPISANDLQNQMTMADIKSSFNTLPIGCHPQKN